MGDVDTTTPDDGWIGALKKGGKSPGSFEQVAPLAEAVTLANIALRVPYKRLLWNAERMEFTNSSDANRLVRREQHRSGWEHIVG